MGQLQSRTVKGCKTCSPSRVPRLGGSAGLLAEDTLPIQCKDCCCSSKASKIINTSGLSGHALHKRIYYRPVVNKYQKSLTRNMRCLKMHCDQHCVQFHKPNNMFFLTALSPDMYQFGRHSCAKNFSLAIQQNANPPMLATCIPFSYSSDPSVKRTTGFLFAETWRFLVCPKEASVSKARSPCRLCRPMALSFSHQLQPTSNLQSASSTA